MGKIVRNADEAARILKELAQTPQATSIHFEFDIDPYHVPKVKYTVERFAYTVTEEEDE